MNKFRFSDWIAPRGMVVPDFMIFGAMKCGTTTVHQILALHPSIFIPDHEINFFDMDDLFQHGDFFYWDTHRWYHPNMSDNPLKYWKWYSNFFSEAPRDCLLGEDSTCYLPSKNAPIRVSFQKKPVKVIICLRQPTERAFSQYWHMLRTGRALYGFEDSLCYTPHYLIERSMYLHQIENVIKYIPKKRIFFFILEEYHANPRGVIRNLMEFLDVPVKDLPSNALALHSNRGTYPKYPKMEALKNRVFRKYSSLKTNRMLPYEIPVENINFKRLILANRIFEFLNPRSKRCIPKINIKTKQFLDQLFKRELYGIDDLIGSNVMELWFPRES